MNTFNTFKNAKSLSKQGLIEEGFNILTGALGSIGKENASGLKNTTFPKQSASTASTTDTSGGSVETTSPNYSTKVEQAKINNGPR